MPRPAHHAALAAANGKIYVSGGFVAPAGTQIPIGGAWEPIDDAWEYDPAADSWKTLAPLPGKRGAAVAARSRRQDLRDRRRHDGGRVQGSVLHVLRTVSGSQHQRRVRPRHEQVGEPPADVGAAQPRVRRCRQRQDLRHRRPHRPRLHPVRYQHGCGGGVQPRERLVECSEGADADTSKRGGVGLGRPQDLRGRRRGDDQRSRRCVSQRRGVRAGDQFVDHAALHADAASWRRGRGDRQSLSPGERDDHVRRGDGVPRPAAPYPHGGARRAGAAVQSESSAGCEERGGGRLPRVRRSPTRATTSTAPKATRCSRNTRGRSRS